MYPIVLNAFLAVMSVLAAVLVLRWYNRLTIGRCTSTKSMAGKTVIITGANSGIGKEAAKDLARRGARVILACRNLDKANDAAKEIARATGKEVVVRRLDLCSFKSVRDFASTILSSEQRLDVLINNAGMTGSTEVHLTEDRLEETFQANYFGHFLLTNLLLDLLKKSAPSRVINVSSVGYILGSIDPATLLHSLRKEKASALRYFDTKLANLLFTTELASRLVDAGVTVNAMHPGVVKSGFGDSYLTLSNLLLKLNIFLFGRSAQEGSEGIVHLAVDDNVATLTGRYFADCTPSWIFPKGRDPKIARKLWNVSEIATKLR